MPLADPKFPSSAAFDAIAEMLAANPQDRQTAIKQAGAVFGIKLKNQTGEEADWTIDLKDKGEVQAGKPAKPTVTLALADSDFADLVEGKANAQKLFLKGKIKVTGDMAKSTKLEPVLKKTQAKAKL